jgi:hypothetical protein
MDPNIVTMPKDEALAKFESYRDAVRVSRAAADRMMMKAFRALSEGKGVLDLTQALAKGGAFEDGVLPKLAVMRADQEIVYFARGSTGGFYSNSERYYLHGRNRKAENARLQFGLPQGSLPAYWSQPGYTSEHFKKGHRTHSAAVPPIPPEHRPSDAFSKYCILWEVDKWEPHSPPGDPILLQPIGGDLYAVLAHWDLTDVERMVLGAILGS